MLLVRQTKTFLSSPTDAIYKLTNHSKQCAIKTNINCLNFRFSSPLSPKDTKKTLYKHNYSLNFQKAAFSSGRSNEAAFSSVLPVFIPYASRGALLATPFLYRYGILSRFPRFSSVVIILPLAAFALLIISSIQTNKYNGRWRLIFLNEQEEYQNSQDDYNALKFSLKLKDGFENTSEFRRVKRVFQELLLATGEVRNRSILKQDWELMILESPDFNARISPSGLLIINSKTLELIGSDHELAFILGHELSHVLFRHSSELENFTEVLNEILLFLTSHLMSVTMLFPVFGELLSPILKVSVPSLLAPYSRYQEFEADKGGLFLASRAGYDPREFPKIWRKLQASNVSERVTPSTERQLVKSRLKCSCKFNAEPAGLESFPTERNIVEKLERISGQTHPTLEERITYLEENIPKVLPIYHKAKDTRITSTIISTLASWAPYLFSPPQNSAKEETFTPLYEDPLWRSWA